jgi:hypothetical protein
MSRYLDAAKSAVKTLFEKQSVHWGGKPEGLLCITVSATSFKRFRSVGTRTGDTNFTFVVPEQSVEMEPFRLDYRIWPVLELLSDITGDPIYRQHVVVMAEAFGRHGFDPVSGLGYFGEMAEFDAVRLAVVDTWNPDCYFKPCDDIPLDQLWASASAALGRMFHSAFYGLITRPATMDYNRFCSYGFDDSQKKASMKFNSHHCACAYTAATLIHWWGFLFARTGDPECLKWAQAMARKWQAVQHPETGLVPSWFGSDRTDEDRMPPRTFCNHWESGTGFTFLRAAEELKTRPEGRELATIVVEMGRRIVTGMTRYGYDPQSRIFPQWFNVDGSRANHTWYTFPSQAERDEAVKRQPILSNVSVFYGAGFYEGIRPWILAGGTAMPYHVALAAKMTGDIALLKRAEEFAVVVREEAGRLTGELNVEGQWSLPGNASYIKMLLVVFEMTGQRRYLDWACELADRELEFLSRPLSDGQPEWWRMYFRNAWIEALLLLHRAITGASSRSKRGFNR